MNSSKFFKRMRSLNQKSIYKIRLRFLLLSKYEGFLWSKQLDLIIEMSKAAAANSYIVKCPSYCSHFMIKELNLSGLCMYIRGFLWLCTQEDYMVQDFFYKLVFILSIRHLLNLLLNSPGYYCNFLPWVIAIV